MLLEPEADARRCAGGDAVRAGRWPIVLDAVEGTLKSIPPARRRDVETVREAVRRAVRSAVDNAWGKKPIVKVLVAVIDGKA